MPLVEFNTFRKSRFLVNAHFETIVPNLLRRVPRPPYRRERIYTPDDDFLDIDFLDRPSEDLVVISHGLEGNSYRKYVMGMARVFWASHWNVAAWNCRSCSGEMNRQARLYHHGDTLDLGRVVQYVSGSQRYSRICLVGFSIGGSMTLKYLGEKGSGAHPSIKRAVTFSVPCSLQGSVNQLERPESRFYKRRFLRKLKRKIALKGALMPEKVNSEGIESVRTFKDLDDRFTAPLHGFRDAQDFYQQASSIHYLDEISIPTLLINARNDPLLDSACYPVAQAKRNANLFLEMPEHGGHVGFITQDKTTHGLKKEPWSFAKAGAHGVLNDP